MRRRDALRTLLTLAGASIAGLASVTPGSAAATTSARLGNEPFDFAQLKGRARALASAPYVPRTRALPDALRRLDWDRYQTIRFRDSRALWVDDRSRFLMKFFHPGWHYDRPVRIDEVVEGRAREIVLDSGMFDYAKSGLSGTGIDPTLGFAGFRMCFHSDPKRDVLAFLGASYFRAVGGDGQYGLSARAVSRSIAGWAGRRNFPFSPSSGSSVLLAIPTFSRPTRCSNRRALPAPIASTFIPVRRW
jgi:periplasmic glucans biosynthesis protein